MRLQQDIPANLETRVLTGICGEYNFAQDGGGATPQQFANAVIKRFIKETVLRFEEKERARATQELDF
jgi:hypothetical protein